LDIPYLASAEKEIREIKVRCNNQVLFEIGLAVYFLTTDWTSLTLRKRFVVPSLQKVVRGGVVLETILHYLLFFD